MTAKQMFLAGIFACFLLITIGCSSKTTDTSFEPTQEMIEQEFAELHDRAFDPSGWVELTPGFEYREHEDGAGIGFRVAPPLLTDEGLQRIKAHVEDLRESASTDSDNTLLMRWESELAEVQELHSQFTTNWPLVQQALARDLSGPEGSLVLPGELQPLDSDGCVRASAMANSGSPGAKSYATASCNPSSWFNGDVDTNTTARAANDWPPRCSDSGFAYAQCRSIAYGDYNCSSTAIATSGYTYNGLTYLKYRANDTHSTC